MKPNFLKLAWVLLGGIAIIAASGCGNTARGVARDTERNTQNVGRGVEHVGEKIQESTR